MESADVDCEEVSKRLGTFIEGGEDNDISASIRAHLETCHDCRRQQRELELLTAQLRALPTRLDLAQRLTPQLETLPARRSSRRLAAAVAVFAVWAILATVALAVPTVAHLVPFLPLNGAVDGSDVNSSPTAPVKPVFQAGGGQPGQATGNAAQSPDLIRIIRLFMDGVGGSGPSAVRQRSLLTGALGGGLGKTVRRVELVSVKRLRIEGKRTVIAVVQVGIHAAEPGQNRLINLRVTLSQVAHGRWKVAGLKESR